MSSITSTYKIAGIPFLKLEREFLHTPVIQKRGNGEEHNFLKLAFRNGGGMGDSIIDVAFLQNLRKCVPVGTLIDYYAKSGHVFRYCPFINHFYNDARALKKDGYDLVLVNRRFWIVERFNEAKIKRLAPVLYDFVKYQLDLRNNILRGNNDNNNLYFQYAQLFGKNRWEQLDLKSITGFDRHNTLYMPLKSEYFSIFRRYQLRLKKYITINRGVDSSLGKNCPKLWPLEHYKDLVVLLRKRYPNLKTVQIGANDKYGEIGADLNLLGKTDVEETKILLKHALIHIDVEGGLVHLNHVLHGKSCVIFGPTSPQEFAYCDNINLRNESCPSLCFWVVRDWSQQCLRGENPPPCMAGTTPEDVMEAVSEYIDNHKPYEWEFVSNDFVCSPDRKLYLVGTFEDDFLGSLSGWGKVIHFVEDVSPHTGEGPHLSNVFQEYGNPYNLPFDDNSLPNIVWFPRSQSFYQNMCFEELLRVLKHEGLMTIFTQSLAKDMIAKFHIDNLNLPFFTLTKR